MHLCLLAFYKLREDRRHWLCGVLFSVAVALNIIIVEPAADNATDSKVDYIKRRGIDRDYSKKLVLDYLGKFNEATRQEINLSNLD